MCRDRVVLFALLAVLAIIPGAASGQSGRSGVEVGVDFVSLRIADSGTTSTGASGRVSVAALRWLSLDGEFTFFPRDDFKQISTINGETVGIIYNRRRAEGVFGIKAGQRGERVGVFGRVRPGFTKLTDRGVDCLQVCALILLMPPEYKTAFALDLGGTIEFYLTSRTLARIDIGDTLIRNRDDALPYATGTTHNLATSVGMGLRF